MTPTDPDDDPSRTAADRAIRAERANRADPTTDGGRSTTRPRVAFVCVQNAGRSQMATAFAERERERRGLRIEVVTGGTDPADGVHPNVVETMAEVGIDLTGREPRAVTPEELRDCTHVVTMGCDAGEVCPATWGGESRDWGLEDPHGKPPAETAAIRDEIDRRVAALFDEFADDPTRAD